MKGERANLQQQFVKKIARSSGVQVSFLIAVS
jgi:hypothetical protein